MVTAILAALLGLFAPTMLTVTFGPNFEARSDILRILTIAAVPSAMGAVTRRHAFPVWVAAALLLNLVMN